MNWNQVCINTTEQAVDIISAIMMDAGAGGVEIDGGSVPDTKQDEYLEPLKENNQIAVKAYYGEQGFDFVLGYIKGRLESAKYVADVNLGSLKIEINQIEDTDWNENFKKHFTTFRAAGNIVVKPTWEDYDAKENDIVIELDPGMAFGSGVHETTRMCLELIQKYMKKEALVLDVGCGSGILGIACSKLGAKEVLALDYDHVSVEVTQANAKNNGVENLIARQSDLLNNADKVQYDIILANIIADVVIRLNQNVLNYLNEDGIYIISGIIEERLDDVLRSLQNNNMVILETLALADWRALAVRRKHA